MSDQFCKLTDGQKAALIVLIGLRTPGHKKAQDMIDAHDWSGLYNALTAMVDNPPYTESDIAKIGNMSTGEQNAFFFLFAMDESKDVTKEAKKDMLKALQSHCYDKLAQKISEHFADASRRFDGKDLRKAWNPNDNQPCGGTPVIDPLTVAIGTLISSGVLLKDFFAETLPDFMTKTFPNWVVNDVGGFFAKIGGQAYESIQVPGFEMVTGLTATGNEVSTGMNVTGKEVATGMNVTGKEVATGMSETGKEVSTGLSKTGKEITNLFGA